MRSYEVRGRTRRAVRKKSKRGQEEVEKGGWAADMTCHRFRGRLSREKDKRLN